MGIAKFSIQHKVCVILAVILCAIFGMASVSRLQMALMPDMNSPMAVVMTYYVGASPSDIEELVTDPLESAIMSVSGVDEVESTSADSVSTIIITYDDDADVDIQATKLREQFDRVDLPDDCQDPIIVNMDMNALMPTAMVALAGDDLVELQTLADDVIGPRLERIDGVASVSVQGGVEQEISVEVDPTKAGGYGLTNAYIAQYLQAENLLYPGGDMKNGSKELTVSTDAKFRSVDDVANMLVALPTGGTVRLSEIADVYLKNEDMDAMAARNQASCVVLQISKQSDANEVSTCRAVASAMEGLQSEYPSLIYSIPYQSSEFIEESVSAAIDNIVQGVLLAAIVVYIYMRKAGATLAISVSMPVCILSVFMLMMACDLTLNIMSMGGIALGVGMIVDNSIVVLDNIYRYHAMGYNRMDSCLEGTKEVTSSVIASTATTVVVFVPLALASGTAGQMFKDLCLTIAFLVLASMVISLTLLPLLCYFMLDETQAHQKEMEKAQEAAKPKRTQKLMDAYMCALRYCVTHLKTAMLIAVGMVILMLLPVFGSNIVTTPEMDQSQVMVNVSTPLGSEIHETAALSEQITEIIMDNVPEMEEIFYVAQPESSMIMVSLVDKGDRSRSSAEIADDLRVALQNVAGCEITPSADLTSIIGGSDDICLEISGDDYDTLTQIANDLMPKIAALDDAVDVDCSTSDLVPEVKVRVKRETAAQYGLTAASIGSTVRAELTGIQASTVTINNTEYDVMIRGDGMAEQSLDNLRSTRIPTGTGGTVPLSAVAEVSIEQAPQTITRKDQSRMVTITGDTISGNVTAIAKQINEILADYDMPDGYSAAHGGSLDQMSEMYGSLGTALLVAMILVYFVLAVQFESFILPLIVMMIIPVAFAAALCVLPLTGRDISLVAMVSLIVLAGTVVNNSIVLVEYIKIRRAQGEDRTTAILNACPTRIRPIMMTTLTTVLAMVPMCLGIGGSNEMMQDMSISMVGGMVMSTLNTLVFTPVYYSVLDDISTKFTKRPKGHRRIKLPKPAFGKKAKTTSK